jgi:hypothetical protein
MRLFQGNQLQRRPCLLDQPRVAAAVRSIFLVAISVIVGPGRRVYAERDQ